MQTLQINNLYAARAISIPTLRYDVESFWETSITFRKNTNVKNSWSVLIIADRFGFSWSDNLLTLHVVALGDRIG